MANKITDMNKIRKALKFHCNGKSKLFISDYLSLSRNTVKKYIALFETLEMSLEGLNEKTDAELERLFSQSTTTIIDPKLEELYGYFPKMERDLKKVGVTIQYLWEIYNKANPDGFKSSQFRYHFKIWSNRVNPVMHMNHKSGDKMYVDYAGKKLTIIDKETGELKDVEFFVAILGASQFTYAEASLSQQKEDFVNSVENALHFFRGVPAAIVPDNLKSAVIKSSRFEPTINETLLDFGEHYQTTILPARAYKPRDKSLVEGAVKILYRRIYVHLREMQFFSLEELNEQIWILLDLHNKRKLTARPYSRLELFTEDEQKELKPLAQDRYQIKYQSFATVMQNGHVFLSQDKAYYSVPYQYLRKKVKLLYTNSRVEIYYKYNRIATHIRNYKPYVYTTNADHLASTHQFVTDMDASRFLDWANKIDPCVGELILRVLDSKNHPEQAYKACLGILSFEKKTGKERLINACKRALDYHIYSYKAIQNILENNLDQINDEPQTEQELPNHDNIRGKNYFK